MNFFYWDASALVKRYAPEVGTDLVNHLFSEVPLDRMMSLIVGTGEVISVFVRKRNNGIVTRDDFSQAMVDFRAEVIDRGEFKLVSVNDAFVFASYPLIEKHSINSTDALVLRSALDIVGEFRSEGNDLVLITTDQRLLRAAQTENLQVFNPEKDSHARLDTLIEEDRGSKPSGSC